MNRQTAHFIGIGGIGMSALARIYLSRGHRVQGSDLKRSDILETLERMGARIFTGHSASHVEGADLVIYSSSIPPDHPERMAAAQRGIPILHRAEALAQICHGKRTIAVTGTHGKTTTTALVGSVLREAGRDPSIVVGGLVLSFGGNAYVGEGPDIVIEADESDSSFLKFSPALAIITNIEREHMDHFGSMEKVLEAYRAFLGRLVPEGEWFGCAEDPLARRLAAENVRPSSLYGFDEDCSVYARNIVECPGGRRGAAFDVWRNGEKLGRVGIKLVGRHNVSNALAAASVGLKLGITFDRIAEALGRYEGAARRFDVRYEDRRYLIVDDYAHHPTEIQKTLGAARRSGRRRIFAVFQPHRFTRTRDLLEEFARSFADADKLIVTDIYPAGEKPIEGFTGESVAEAVRRSGHRDASYVRRDEIDRQVKTALKEGDLLITLGAGDIYQAAYRAAESLREGIFDGVRGKVLFEEPLSRHTTLKVGGPAEFWIEPEDAEDLKRVLEISRDYGLAVKIFGSGSNVLPPDRGLRGIVIHLGAPYWREIHEAHGRIRARSGVPNALFIQFVIGRDRGGCEFLLGIPGNIGGAVAMNAGSHGQSVEAFLESVTLMDFGGRTKTLSRREIPFGYRTSNLSDAVILEAVFSFPLKEKIATQKILETYRDHRQKTQDLQHPSAGCMFKNPPGGRFSSGKLIEDAGLKGRRIGRAQVSTKHANFIINLGGASSEDIFRLIREVQEAVKKKFDVELETEVKIL